MGYGNQNYFLKNFEQDVILAAKAQSCAVLTAHRGGVMITAIMEKSSQRSARIVLVVGPSGVGKSTTIEAAARLCPNAIFRPLDGLAASLAFERGLIERPSIGVLDRLLRNHDLLLLYGMEAIGKLAGENPGTPLVIDVGAGFQVAKTAAELHRIHLVIALTADQQTAYSRVRLRECEKRPFAEFVRVEFSPHRQAVYDQAHHCIDTTNQEPAETVAEFVTLVRQLLGVG